VNPNREALSPGIWEGLGKKKHPKKKLLNARKANVGFRFYQRPAAGRFGRPENSRRSATEI